MDEIKNILERNLSVKQVMAGTLAVSGSVYAAVGEAAITPGRNSDQVNHVLNRITMGVTPELLNYVDSIGGITNYLEEQLAPLAINDLETDALIKKFTRMRRSSEKLILQKEKGKVRNELNGVTVVRAVKSNRQLQEVMVDFWSNHFNVNAKKGRVAYYKVAEDKVFRKLALTSFRQLLMASARSPAMLFYLDNFKSRADRQRIPNENYARELMELFTVGVTGGYDEQDVIEAAYVFTGWTIGSNNGRNHVFEFKSSRNRLGPLEAGGDILGWQPVQGSGSEQNGKSFLRHLARHPATAEFICWKLCRHFVSDNLSMEDSLVRRISQVYLANDTEIVPVLRAIFQSSRFLKAKGEKVKRSNAYLYAMLRSTKASFDFTNAELFGRDCRRLLTQQQHALFEAEPPTGYPDVASAYINTGTLMSRWNLAFALIKNKASTRIKVDYAQFQLGNLSTVGQLVNRLSIKLMGRRLPSSERDVLFNFLGKVADNPLEELDLEKIPALSALIFASASFQVR